jgi:hypothetical protein
MTRFVGLDVSQKMTAICVVDYARRAPRENGCDFCGGRGMKKTIGKRTYDEATATRVASYEFDHPDRHTVGHDLQDPRRGLFPREGQTRRRPKPARSRH